MRRIGTVVLLQVQRASLKIAAPSGNRNDRRYDPLPLLPVEVLDVDTDGVTGIFPSRTRVIDVHNRRHLDSKNNAHTNDISVGFTTHYVAMRDRFGPHMTTGIAGENVLVAGHELFTDGKLGQRLVFMSTLEPNLVIDNPRQAEPCLAFSRWALNMATLEPTDPSIVNTLRFLRNGMRGYYASCLTAGSVRIGDEVFLD